MPDPDCVFLSRRRVMQMLNIGPTKLWKLTREGRLVARKLDGKTLIEAASVQRLIEGLPRTGHAA